VLIYVLLNFRVKPGDMSDGPPVHGHTTLEIVWTVIPTILVIAISVVSAVVLAQNSKAGDNPLKIRVTAQQFAWAFTYPNGETFGSMRLPVDRHVKLTITANDVIHSFWVPQFAQKQDAVPGDEHTLVITPTETGTFPVICTELCGLGHAIMRSQAIVMTEAEYDDWYQSAKGTTTAGVSGGSSGNDGEENSGSASASSDASAEGTFTKSGCGACHTFSKIASARGKVGPSLDDLSKSAAAAGKPLEDFIRESIVDPTAYVPPNYQPGTMPAFDDQITGEDLDALVQYLAENTK
jgi:cytochrome c oxidase subunit II